ncbi:hypothetical protein [Paraburkholderia dinghuensis]|uniref:Fis family transcriptional regulator n=1 Tax=Paraburkholderia dinghuensis TaxID=2305225 RepID=A0A3N6PLL9_9BURK|nr:hypothetical protein [Paraburkholderia dinghuensis]RQG99865.1 hypothetical protein D1Y85_25985 [Paraburkholderia dinghuensis]
MLLPLPVARVRALSLENHLALATVRAARGNLDQLCCLLRVVYLAFYLREETAAGADIEPYRRAEAALDACIGRMERHEPCLMLDLELAAIERVLVLHDDQLAGTPKHRYAQAWERLQRFIASQQRSPIPAIPTGQ